MTWHGSTAGHYNLYFEEHVSNVSYTCTKIITVIKSALIYLQ